MEIRTIEQVAFYEPPVLVELAEFLKDTHGWDGWTSDSLGQFFSRA
jgi:hypothetical protein